jgi:hypothetical protein
MAYAVAYAVAYAASSRGSLLVLTGSRSLLVLTGSLLVLTADAKQTPPPSSATPARLLVSLSYEPLHLLAQQNFKKTRVCYRRIIQILNNT